MPTRVSPDSWLNTLLSADTGLSYWEISVRIPSLFLSRSDATPLTVKRWQCAPMADRQSLMSGYWSASETIPTSSAAWKPAGPIRSESIWPGTGIPCWVIPCTAAAKNPPLPRRASASTRRFWDLSIPFQEPISKRKHPCRIISIIFLKS